MASVSIVNIPQGTAFPVFDGFYDDYGHHSTIWPSTDDRFGCHVELDDFDFQGCTHLKVLLFVDDDLVRIQYLEAGGSPVLDIVAGRKRHPDSDPNEATAAKVVEFTLLFDDIFSPPAHEGDGYIQVRLELGVKIHKSRHRHRYMPPTVKETQSFKHGAPTEVKPRRHNGLRFEAVRRRQYSPLVWFFRYAHAPRGCDNVPATFPGKRPRYADDEEPVYKRPRVSGLERELLHGQPKQFIREKMPPGVATEPKKELFPENNGVTFNQGYNGNNDAHSYHARPYYGGFR